MKKYLVLHITGTSELHLSKIRVFLQQQTYIEINSVFYISSSKRFKNSFKNDLFDNEINFILTFVNIKTGGDFEAFGIDEDKKSKLEKIILSN